MFRISLIFLLIGLSGFLSVFAQGDQAVITPENAAQVERLAVFGNHYPLVWLWLDDGRLAVH
jgi:hypothetical protein